jgi:hypothetical protein
MDTYNTEEKMKERNKTRNEDGMEDKKPLQWQNFSILLNKSFT